MNNKSVKITYFLDLTSSWCYWAEPAWAELKRRYAKASVEFDWQIALLDASGMSKSRTQAEWFYRRSGTIVKSPFMLNSGWLDPYQPEFLEINCVAEAAKDFDVTDDTVRLALMEAAMREGQKIADGKLCAQIAAKAAGLDTKKLLARAGSKEVVKRVRAATAQFHALQMTQRRHSYWTATLETGRCSQASGGLNRWPQQLTRCSATRLPMLLTRHTSVTRQRRSSGCECGTAPFRIKSR
jgi:predicted DsbA family dithiol-disulfide isomerase